MRPLRLDVAGFTVFREPVTVDFTDADFFALVGPTGSGKSTVLDAICFALYGTVPRWADRRAIANALAPSCTEARVRLVFESAGVRYAVSRVVRRDGKGQVGTRSAALEALPRGFDLARLDTGLTADDLGEVLAGTASEVDGVVVDVVGLPYEQFTKCVVLPQGEFAAFLHAKPAQRQEILVKLLGLEVYGRIRERAGAVAAEADAQVSAADRLLAGLTDIDDAALGAAQQRVRRLRQLAGAVDDVVPQLDDAQRAADAAQARLAELDDEIDRLAAVRAPADAAGVAAAATAAQAALAAARAAVTEAEETEEKLRGELASAADPAELRGLRADYAEQERLAAEAAELTSTLQAAEAEHLRTAKALEAARTRAAGAATAVEAARTAYADAQAADRAAALRPHLRLGEPCPVCSQPVARLPAAGEVGVLAAAKAAGEAARTAADAAERSVSQRDAKVRELDRRLATLRGRAEQLIGGLGALTDRLAGAAPLAVVERDLAALAALQRRLDGAAQAVRAAREGQRTAATAAERAQVRLRTAWRQFDAVRDAIAVLAPPAADRDDLAVAWSTLSAWAGEAGTARRAARTMAAAAVESAAGQARAVGDRIAELFEAAGADPPQDGDYLRAAAVAVERGAAAVRRIEERRAEAAGLREQRARHERQAQVARTLAGHLRANNFERWLLEEALDSLVDGASRTLRELSNGQYDLGHHKGEFYVVDHHDAGLRRAVRTLSGGETFQASLALALALSEQLAGLSTATASLESIVLDEGFGTLDATTLDTVAATLESLAARGDRMVGVVTHVPALAERIPVRFEVRKDARTAYVERCSA